MSYRSIRGKNVVSYPPLTRKTMVEPAKLHEALLKAKIKLACWLGEKLAELDVDYWHNLVMPKVSYNQKLIIERKRCTKLSQLDLAVLLRILNKNWDDLAYRFNIEDRIRIYLNEVQDIRNRYAHMSDYPNAEDFARDVDTLARFLEGIGIDEEFIMQVKAIGKEKELEPEVDDSREPDHYEEPLELDSGLNPQSIDLTIGEEGKVEFPSNEEVKVLARDPFDSGASLIKNKMHNCGVVGYSSVVDVNGEDAKQLYLSLRDVAGVPIMTGISYAIVAKRDAENYTEITDAKVTLDSVLAEDNVDGFEMCVAQEEPENRLIWFFGEKKKDGTSLNVPLVIPPPMPRIFEIALPQWWSKIAKEGWFQALPLLRIEEVQNTKSLSEQDLWRYMKTYAPRSWAEAFYLSKTLACEVLNVAATTGSQFSVLDIGCNVGCAMFGVLDALAARTALKRPIKVVAVDGNATALDLLNGFNKARASEDDPCAVATRDVELTCINRTFAEEMQASSLGEFNIIVASKFLGECGNGAFTSFLGYAQSHLAEDGCCIIIEVLKHEKALRDAISETGIKDVAIEHLGVKVGVCGEKCSDNEEVVAAVIYKRMFN